jgi:hypothetical protein
VITIKNSKKVEKVSYLPDIKVNIILNDNHKYKNSDSEDSDNDNVKDNNVSLKMRK